MRVAVIGQGYVGLPLAISIAKAGHKVIGFDLNPELVANLNSGISHIEDIKNLDLDSALSEKRYRATSDLNLLCDTEIAIIAVPTPLDEKRNPDTSYVESASKILGENLKSSALIINESTSYPGTLRDLIAPIVSRFSPHGIKHRFAVSPERVDPGNTKWTIKNTPRLMAGLDEESSQEVVNFYSTFCNEITLVSSPEVAESAKLFENTFRQVNIALVNEFSLICRALGISVHEVLEAANTKPYGFMKFSPGVGVGGHCIPVDPTYLAYISEKNGIEPRFIKLANQINLETPREIIKKIEKTFAFKLENKNILICGLAYKSNISDIRESPAKILVEELSNSGSKVSIYDPHVVGYELDKLNDKNFDLGIIAVSHDNFNLDFIDKKCDKIFDVTGKFYKYPTI